MIFLEEPTSQFSFSTQANLVPLSPICPSSCLVLLKSLRFKFLIDLLKCAVRISLLPISRLNSCSASYNLVLSNSLSSDGRINFPFMDFVEIFSFSERMHNVVCDLDLVFSFDCELKIVGTTFSVQICTCFLDATTTVNQLMIPPLFLEAST